MADPILEREHEITEEEREHREKMAERMRALLSGDEISEPAKPEGVYEYATHTSELSDRAPAYQVGGYSANEYHPPVVPNSPNAPSARKRFDDYVPVTVGMKSVQRMGDMPVMSVTDHAPVKELVYSPADEESAIHAGLFENLLYKDGKLVDMTAPAPEAPAMDVEAPVYEPSYPTFEPAPERQASYEPAPSYETAPSYTPAYEPTFAPSYGAASEEEDDATPTPRTMSHRNVAEEHASSKLLTALSFRTKMVLLAVAAVVILLLAVVCINTAIINSMDEGVAERREQLAGLTDRLDTINSEIEDLTSPENIERWAIEHNMSR